MQDSTLACCSFWYPDLNEQSHVIAGITRKSAPVTGAINRLEREVALLHEYRTRLIADEVTGKLDVREVAAGLPEPTESIDESRDSDYVELDNDDEIEETESMD